MKFIVEHMEPSLSDWVIVEYKHMIEQVGSANLILSAMTSDTIAIASKVLPNAQCTSETALEIAAVDEIVLLDPSAPTPLSPQDASFKFCLFGGILGDDPPQDRTGMLRKLGFQTRHLGPVQMTTDTAVLVAKRIVEDGMELDKLKFIDRPSIQLYKNEAVEMPFRYLENDHGKPIIPPGFMDVLRKSTLAVMSLFDFRHQFLGYAEFHNDKNNQRIHMVFVPLILWTAMVWLSNAPAFAEWPLSSVLPLNAAFLFTAVYASYYLVLYPFVGAIAAPFLLSMLLGANAFVNTPMSVSPNVIATLLHIISWIFQFIGHGAFEKRRPALMDNLLHALVLAPFFVLCEYMFGIGWNPTLAGELQAATDKRVALYRASQRKKD